MRSFSGFLDLHSFLLLLIHSVGPASSFEVQSPLSEVLKVQDSSLVEKLAQAGQRRGSNSLSYSLNSRIFIGDRVLVFFKTVLMLFLTLAYTVL